VIQRSALMAEMHGVCANVVKRFGTLPWSANTVVIGSVDDHCSKSGRLSR
jgi:hypothetical protein